MADNPTKKANVSALVPTVISKEIEWLAQESQVRRFREFVIVKEDLQRQPGDTLYIPKVPYLPDAQELDETKTLRGSGKIMYASSVSFQPTEVGDEVQYTEYSQLVTQNDLEQMAVKLLTDQSSKKENLDIRSTLYGGLQIYYANGVANQAAVADTVSTDDIDKVVEELIAAEAPFYGGEGREGYLFGWIHPYAYTALKNDLLSVANYAQAVPQIYAGEIGMYNRVRWIESAYAAFRVIITSALAQVSGTVTVDASKFVPADQYCDSETWTFTCSADADSVITVAGSKWGNCTFTVGATSAKTSFLESELAANNVICEGKISQYPTYKSPWTLQTGGLTSISGATVASATTQRNCCLKIMAQRHAALAIIKRVTLLGAEEYDYGRIVGLAWNAFRKSGILNDSYGWQVESKR